MHELRAMRRFGPVIFALFLGTWGVVFLMFGFYSQVPHMRIIGKLLAAALLLFAAAILWFSPYRRR